MYGKETLRLAVSSEVAEGSWERADAAVNQR